LGGGAWPLVVGVVKCLVNFENERDHSTIFDLFDFGREGISNKFVDNWYQTKGSLWQ